MREKEKKVKSHFRNFTGITIVSLYSDCYEMTGAEFYGRIVHFYTRAS